jgi:DNA polymerase-3 subunit delta'
MEKHLFNGEIGHSDVQQRILHSIKNERLPHAFLFYGKEGTGKSAFAIEIAKLLNCEKGPLVICGKCPACIKISKLEHPDVKFIFPVPGSSIAKPQDIGEALQEKSRNPYKRVSFPAKHTNISIDMIRELKYESKFKLYEGKKKIFIIDEADTMRPEAANALLKLLEEPPANLMLILISSHIHRILATIKSRCQLVHFPPLEGDIILKIIRKFTPQAPDHLASLIRLALGNIKLAFDFIDEDVLQRREQAIEFLRKVVLIEKSHELLANIDEITKSRDRRNMILLLFFILTWFHDAFHYKEAPQQSGYLINSDLTKKLKGFVNGYPQADFSQIINLTQKAIQDLEDPRNLNPTLIFTDLSIKLNRSIKPR